MNWRDKLKWGDESLKTPEHDALMLWLDENCVSIGKKLFPQLTQFCDVEWERPFSSKGGSILCFIDLYMLGLQQIRPDYAQINEILFEVKPKIESIGELLRQLQSYDHYASVRERMDYRYNSKCKLVVVSPDTKAKDIILKHGFYFVNPDDEI